MTKTCPHCGCEQLVVDYSRGEVVCPKCGTVVEDHIITAEEFYNMHKNMKERKIESPLQWTAPLKVSRSNIQSVEILISTVYDDFLKEVEKMPEEIKKYLQEFERWVYTEGVKVLLKKAYKAQMHGSKFIAKKWLEGQFKQNGALMLKNLFLAWLVKKKRYSVYYLWKKLKVIRSPESIYTWLRIL